MGINNSIIENSAIIDSSAVIGKGNYIGHNTIIKGNVTIGDNNYIGSNVIIGEYPQHSTKKFEFKNYTNFSNNKGIKIGSNNVIREFTSIHLPITSENTIIGNNCYIMAYNHIAHDSVICNHVIMANNIQMGGYSIIHDYANIGLSSAIHQRSTIGAYAMVGMGSIVTKDVLPFMVVMGSPTKYANKINEYGMNRFGLSENEITCAKKIYNGDTFKDIKLEVKIISLLKKFYKDSRNSQISISEKTNNSLLKYFLNND